MWFLVIPLSLLMIALNIYVTWTTLRFSFNKLRPGHHKIEVSVPFNIVHNKIVGDISVGTPNDGAAQTFSVFFNTLTAKTWLASAELCAQKDCTGQEFSAFDGSRSKTYVKKNTKPFRQKYGEELEVTGFISEDTFTFGSGKKALIVKNLEFGEVNSMTGKFKGIDGMLGLGLGTSSDYHDSLVSTLTQQPNLEPVFGIYIHTIQHENENGKLVFGKNDKGFAKGPFNKHDVIKDHRDEYTGWNIEINSAEVSSSDGQREEFKLSVDTSTPVPMLKDISLPKRDVTAVLAKIFARVDFASNKGIFKCQSDWKKLLPDFTLVIGGIEYVLHPEDYVVPVNQAPLGENCGVAISSIGGSKSVRLGQPFMKKYYTRFNFGTKQIEFAEAVPIH